MCEQRFVHQIQRVHRLLMKVAILQHQVFFHSAMPCEEEFCRPASVFT